MTEPRHLVEPPQPIPPGGRRTARLRRLMQRIGRAVRAAHSASVPF